MSYEQEYLQPLRLKGEVSVGRRGLTSAGGTIQSYPSLMLDSLPPTGYSPFQAGEFRIVMLVARQLNLALRAKLSFNSLHINLRNLNKKLIILIKNKRKNENKNWFSSIGASGSRMQ